MANRAGFDQVWRPETQMVSKHVRRVGSLRRRTSSHRRDGMHCEFSESVVLRQAGWADAAEDWTPASAIQGLSFTWRRLRSNRVNGQSGLQVL